MLKNQSQVEIYCKQQYCAKEQISALNPYKFDRKMHNFFKDTIPKGENPKSRNGGMAEWRKMTPNPKTRNGGKCPQILKHGTAENDPKS